MPHKHLMFRSAAREKILRGTTLIADAIRVTLGPRSKCVLIEKKFGKPIVCNDGVTIAREIDLADPEENLGAQMIRQAAERTGDLVGDGTSTATILAHAIYADGLRNVAAGASAIDIKRGLDRGAITAISALKKISRPVASIIEKTQVATVSAHNDSSIGKLVAEAMDKIGREGIITVEEAQSTETVLEIVEGTQFDRGFVSPYFINRPDKMLCVLDDPYILICDRALTHLQDVLSLLEQLAKEGRSLLIVAEDIEGEALATLVVNNIRGLLKCAAVKAPGFGDRRHEMLRDLAIITGSQLISEQLGMKLEKTTIEMLGRAQRVEMTKDHTTIIGGRGSKSAIQSRAQEIKSLLQTTTSSYDKEKLEERLAKIAGGVAVIRVGAGSESELKSKKEAFDDAINATKAAVEEGIIPGGGLALIKIMDKLQSEEDQLTGDELTGIRILRHALEAPARQIAENSAADGGVIVAKMKEQTGNLGFDAAKGKFVDLMDAGIIDATKVVRIALENAVSVAGILLLTEATLTEISEPSEIQKPNDSLQNLMT